MRICVYGAGGTGGHFAARLAAAGHEVSVVVRGAHLAAVREQGLTLLSGEERVTVRVRATDDPAALGPQDAVIVTVKATGLAAMAPRLAPLLGARTVVLFPQNGIPWWYPLGLAAGRPAPPALPGFALAEAFLTTVPAERLLGGVIYSANELEAPGVVRNTSPGANRLEFGALAGPPDRPEPLRAALREAGLGAPATDDPRRPVWRKLMGNMSASAIALVAGVRSSDSRRDPVLRAIHTRLVEEGLATAAAHGYDLSGEVSAERIRAGLPDHRPSILQDYEAGRPMEVAEILLAPMAFARAAGIATPTLDTVAAIAVRRAADRGLFDPAGLEAQGLW